MKTSSIEIGGIYYDNKVGVREVVSMDGASRCDDTRVTYRILAAKAEREYCHAKKAMVSLIGSTSKCDLASLAAWAKVKVPDGEKGALLAQIAASKMRLPPGEAAFMASVFRECAGTAPLAAGTSISFSPDETRQVHRIEKKGLVSVSMSAAGGEIVLTDLGAAWLRAHGNTTSPTV